MKMQEQVNELMGRGFTVIEDKIGREAIGNRIVRLVRTVEGVPRCFAEVREVVRRDYDAGRDFWASTATGEARAVTYQPTFNSGAIL